MNRDQDERGDGEPGSAAGVVRMAAALAVIREQGAELLAGDQDAAVVPGVLLEVARVVDQVVRTGQGLLLQVLARVDAVKAARGGLGTWLTAQLGYSSGRARALAQDARRLGALPEVSEQLTAGTLPVGSSHVLARAAHAAKTTQQDPTTAVADTLSTLHSDGVQAAERQVRVLEHTLNPKRGERQRAQQRTASFARVAECESGMVRFDVLLDAERATLLRTALDMQVSAWLRERQYDGTDPLPEDVHSTEQLTAEAFTRLAEVFLNATEAQRANRYTPTVVYYAPAPGAAPMQESAPQDAESVPDPSAAPGTPVPAGYAETGYGALIPTTRLPAPQDPAALRLTVAPDGQPIALDGQAIDRDPAARLASPAQRLALAFRDRHCTEPGCTRPAAWSLHAHHRIAYAQHGPTTMRNLTLYCPEHHTLAHQTSA